MNKEETHKARNEAINEAKGRGRIHFSDDVEHFKDGFDAAVKLYSISDASKCAHNYEPCDHEPIKEFDKCTKCGKIN